MIFANKNIENNYILLIRSLEEIGYKGLIERSYEFPDYFSTHAPTRVAAAVAFGGTPFTYDKACFAIVISNGKSGRRLISDYRALGAPRAFEIHEDAILHWKVARSIGESPSESFRPEEIAQAVRRNGDDWKPDQIIRLKNLVVPGIRQRDFIDAGLIPALEEHVQHKLGPLLHRIIDHAKIEFEKRNSEPIDEQQLIELVFRVLWGKVLHDRGILPVSQSPLPPDATTLLRAVNKHYRQQGTIPSDKGICQSVVDRMWDGFSFKHISVEVLAYLWEHALITDDARAEFSIHATPPSIARYIASRLPIEEIPEPERQIVEPCCGSGTFLVAALQRLRDLVPSALSDEARHEYLKSMLHGFDVDPIGLSVARRCLMLADFPNPNGWNLTRENVLDWKNAKQFQSAISTARIVMCNPPFGPFSPEDRSSFSPQSVLKQVELLSNILSRLPKDGLIGFVMPSQIMSGGSYRHLRRQLAMRYEDIEILSLPDLVFAEAEQETALIIAKSPRKSATRPLAILHRKVPRNKDWRSFKDGNIVKREDAADRELNAAEESLAVPDLNQVWAFLKSNSTISNAANKIHRGIEWNVPLDENRELLITDRPGSNYARGLPSAPKGTFFIYQPPPVAYLCIDDKYKKTEASYNLPWKHPKVVMNAKRRSRGPWRISAFLDCSGLVCYQSYTCIWPNSNWTGGVLAAILNGYVANAFIAANEVNRDITIEILREIPLPDLQDKESSEIDVLVNKYGELFSNNPKPPAYLDETTGQSAIDILNEIDALVLKAYRLPSHLLSEVLLYFKNEGKIRAVPYEFDGPSRPLIRQLNRNARKLIAGWSTDESGYDEREWPEIKRAIEEDSLSSRKRFP